MHTLATQRLRDARDRGFTLVELIIAGVLGVVVLGLIATVFLGSMKAEARQAERQTALAEVEGVSAMLMRDVQGGTRVHGATDKAFTIERVIEGVCEIHTYSVDDGVVSLETAKYAGSKCTGTPTKSTTTHASNLRSDAVFTYFGTGTDPLADPVRPGDIKRVAWKLVRGLEKSNSDIEYESAAAFTGRGASTTGTGTPGVTPRAPQLEVITDRSATGVIGVHAPVLQWRDDTASAVASWSVYRVATAEGVTASDSWKLMTVLANGDTSAVSQTLSWTDSTLPAGYTAQYVVRANPASGKVGPSSNQVSSGLRPAVTQGLTVTGDTQALRVSWTAQTGATRYDLYRDGVLYKKYSQLASTLTRSGATISWVDSTGYGHAHTYTVVASNRWELAATHPQGAWQADSQTREVEVGTQLAAKLGVTGKQQARLAPAVQGARTAPITPAINAFVNRQPADVGSLTAVWDTTLEPTWAAAQWTGAWADKAAAATRYTLTRGSTVISDRVTTLRASDKTAPRGVSSTWTLVADSSGATAPAAANRKGVTTSRALLTWPSAPTCTVGQGTPITSAQIVAVTKVGAETVTATRARLTAVGTRQSGTTYSGTPRAAGYTVAGNSATFSPLSHATAHTYRAQAQNAAPGGGYGPWGANCAATTARLDIPTLTLVQGNATGGQPTRALKGNITFLNGAVRTRTLTPGQGGLASQVTGADQPVWTQLTHNRSHTLVVTNSDSFNTFTKSVSRSTMELTATLTLTRDASIPTRKLNATLTSTHAVAQSMTLRPGSSGAASSGSSAKTASFDRLADGVNHGLSGTVSDGYNQDVPVKVTRTTATALLNAPSVSVSAVTTKAFTVTVTADSQPGTSRAIQLSAGNWHAAAKKTFDNRTHNTSFIIRGRNTDGYNARDADATVRTRQLVAAAAACTSSRDSTYPPATITWRATTSDTTMSRYALRATTAGTYSSTATRVTTDGHNLVSDSSICSHTVPARPWITAGAGDPGSSPTCTPYLGWGEVQSLLRSAIQSGGQIGTGYYIGAPISGSYAADKGAHLRGSAGDRTLSCAMYRAHHIYLEGLAAQPVERFGATVVWTMSGLGAQ